MILEIAVADAYSIPFEFLDRDKFPGVNDLSAYYQHPEYHGLKPSQYTDDTLRTIATARVILTDDNWAHPFAFVEALQNEFALDPRDGFSRRFQQYFEDNKAKSPVDFMRGLTRKNSNGSLMGCLPCGFLPKWEDVMLAAMMQAISTHSHDTVPYAQALALTAHHLMRGETIGDIPDWLDHCNVGLDREIYEFRRTKPKYARMTVRSTTSSVFDLIYNFTSLSNIIEAAVEARGDTDSVAALAVGLMSLSSEGISDLPEHLISQLEFGNGRKLVEMEVLEARLRKKYLGEEFC